MSHLVPLCQKESASEIIHLEVWSSYKFLSIPTHLCFIWKGFAGRVKWPNEPVKFVLPVVSSDLVSPTLFSTAIIKSMTELILHNWKIFKQRRHIHLFREAKSLGQSCAGENIWWVIKHIIFCTIHFFFSDYWTNRPIPISQINRRSRLLHLQCYMVSRGR